MIKHKLILSTVLFFSFIAQAQVPTSVSVIATRITFEKATLNARVNPNGASTTVSFEYGLTTSYGSAASVSGTIFSSTLKLLIKNMLHVWH